MCRELQLEVFQAPEIMNVKPLYHTRDDTALLCAGSTGMLQLKRGKKHLRIGNSCSKTVEKSRQFERMKAIAERPAEFPLEPILSFPGRRAIRVMPD